MKGLMQVERVMNAASKVIANIHDLRAQECEKYLKTLIGPRETKWFGLVEARPEITTIEEARAWVEKGTWWDRPYYDTDKWFDAKRLGREEIILAQRLLDAGHWFMDNGVKEVFVTDKEANVLRGENGVVVVP